MVMGMRFLVQRGRWVHLLGQQRGGACSGGLVGLQEQAVAARSLEIPGEICGVYGDSRSLRCLR